jgi:uncharacterized protein with WD repeat
MLYNCLYFERSIIKKCTLSWNVTAASFCANVDRERLKTNKPKGGYTLVTLPRTLTPQLCK